MPVLTPANVRPGLAPTDSGRKPSTRKNADALAAKVVRATQAVNADSMRCCGESRRSARWALRRVGQESLLHVDLAS